MIYGAEHLSVHFFVICVSLVKCLLKSFAHFQSEFSVFLLLNLKSSLDILDNSPLSDMSFKSTFFQSVACLLLLLTWFFYGTVSGFNEVPLISYFFHAPAFGVVSRKLLSYPILSILSPGNYIGLHFTFEFVIHLGLIFVNGLCLHSFHSMRSSPTC